MWSLFVFSAPRTRNLDDATIAMPINWLHVATYVLAAIASLTFTAAMIKVILATGKFVGVVEKMPKEMEGIRAELRNSNENTLKLLAGHGERIARVEVMLDLDDMAQARVGPRKRQRRGTEL